MNAGLTYLIFQISDTVPKMEMEDILFGLDDGLLQFASSPSSPNVFEGIAPPHTYADFNESVQATLNAEESLLPNVDETFIKKAGTLTNLEVAVQRQQFSSVANATSLSPICEFFSSVISQYL